MFINNYMIGSIFFPKKVVLILISSLVFRRAKPITDMRTEIEEKDFI